MLLFEMRFEEFPAQLERDLETLNRGISDDRILGEGESLIKTRDRAREIGSQ